MIKFVMICYRKPGTTRAEFQDYWLNKHAPLFGKFADVFGTKRYVQCHTLDSPMNDAIRESRGMAEACDGVAEVWFESEEQLMAAMSSPEGQEVGATLTADENNFIDHVRSSAFIARECEL
ncbi:MAG: EthD domain-containing protein [Planctomycetota bacterium]